MAKIRARNVDDALFARIEQSAMKNERSLEGRSAWRWPDSILPGPPLLTEWLYACLLSVLK